MRLSAQALRSFHRRRIAIPVGADALVLDIGSGDKPHWRADVLLDRYLGADHAGQRSGRAEARVDRPLFDADAAAMPFADGVFDYVICSHVLEHVVDPAAVVAEITRVGRAGYIEVPEAASAKILDFPSHLWWCRQSGSTLVMTAKTAPAFDAEIQGYIEESGIERRLADLLDADFDRRVIALPWSGHVEVVVEGEPPPEVIAGALAGGSHHRVAESLAARLLTGVMTLPRRGQRRRDPIRYDDVVKPELRTGTGDVLAPRIYRITRTG
jgi:SAM-dependent methyltransferase